jgi:hypothetical protein
VYHPQSIIIFTTVNLGGTSEETINKTELAEIAADLTNEHTLVAKNSTSALWQI